MAIDDLLRVARWARGEGRGPLLEAMLTLAVAEAGPGEGWAERCRARLVAERPGHFLGASASLEQALADPRVAGAIRRLRGQYPAGRVGWLRFRSEVAAGPYLGEPAPLGAVIDDLLGRPAEAEVRRDAAEAIRGPRARARAEVAVAARARGEPRRAAWGEVDVPDLFEDEEGHDEGFHLAVLLSIALLLASVERDRRTRAA